MARYQNNNLLGIGLMLLATLLFAIMDATAKLLVSADVSAIQVIAVRSWMITLFILLLVFGRGELKQLATRRPRDVDRRRADHRRRHLRRPP